MVISMIDVGEETGQLPEMLLKIAEVYDDEVDNSVAGLTSMLEPIMIVLLAVIVGTIVIALVHAADQHHRRIARAELMRRRCRGDRAGCRIAARFAHALWVAGDTPAFTWAFTIIEVLVVLAIILVLAGLVLTTSSYVAEQRRPLPRSKPRSPPCPPRSRITRRTMESTRGAPWIRQPPIQVHTKMRAQLSMKAWLVIPTGMVSQTLPLRRICSSNRISSDRTIPNCSLRIPSATVTVTQLCTKLIHRRVSIPPSIYGAPPIHLTKLNGSKIGRRIRSSLGHVEACPSGGTHFCASRFWHTGCSGERSPA